MINRIFRYSAIYILLILFQVLILNNIQLSGYANPYAYILFILILPVETAGWLLIVLAFLAGLVVDLFMGSPGMHASASAAAAFARPLVLRSMAPRDGYEPDAEPSMAQYGFRWFAIYTLIIVALHHIVLFWVEVMNLADFMGIMLRAAISTLFSAIMILMIEYFRKGR